MADNDKVNPYVFILYISIAAVIIAAIALAVSIKSCYVSETALEEVTDFFLEENRPFVTLTPQKFTDSNSYLKTSEKNNRFEIWFRFEIKNAGRVAARDIALPEIQITPMNIHMKKSTLSYERLSKISLGPDDLFYFSPRIIFEVDSSAVREILRRLNESHWKSSVLLLVSYAHGLEPSVRYGSSIEYDIDRDQAMPLKTEIRRMN
jgi:hypothetical protein